VSQTYPIVMSATKNKIQNFPIFLKSNLKDSASLEGLISSLALSVGKLWLEKVTGPILALRSLQGSTESKIYHREGRTWKVVLYVRLKLNALYENFQFLLIIQKLLTN